MVFSKPVVNLFSINVKHLRCLLIGLNDQKIPLGMEYL